MTETPTNDPDNYPHSPGVLVVPTEEDIPVIRRLLTEAYDNIREDYEARQESPRYTEEVEREGSLIQELQAQLRVVEDD
jgi:hypothetical protein